ncbi:mandelate racemase/muconate lactonizing enzyme family protein [Rathayibacter sp. VKM Ac-2856]|uniref:mandelate racemase/muconate lactonizing enzyme family protein n=1 Tax=unclassified Rathayibacter TaxID=2609250 RepID=UPI00156387EF|nr:MULTISPECIES: mandelate racemase/muconate lactonizing enzyme family protein [unclassified Rathayibacter]NQX03360.1 mandelate racemase/muconate lactonizing enzyme family protein [Rathayibacter sp. VKM Ac-2858]NQX18528.1 mandelate racemase/muconate lactonizing enzyme family protein [Rathayibacter sp. VKM Ac-2856]
MKITGYRLLTTYHDWGRPIGDVNGFIASGITSVPLVLVETDVGVTGIGMGSHQDIDKLFPALEGQDPRAVSSLYDRMLARVFKAGHAGATFGGIGTLDTALWDIKAKLAGEPLWRLLGGSDRFVAGYASALDIALSDDQLASFYCDAVDRGYASGKLKGGRDFDADLRRLRIMEDALQRNSPEPGLMLDANESWNVKQAVRYVSRLEEQLDLTWIEEPIRRWDAVGHARLSSSVRAAVATGENLTGLEQYRPLLDAKGVDIVQAASVWGVTHFLRVAVAAHSRDLPVSPIGLSANAIVANAAAAVPNHLTAEVQDFGQPFGVSIDQQFIDGGIVLGDRPGAGLEIDEAAIVADQRSATWLTAAGPHVRSPRAGLQLAP